MSPKLYRLSLAHQRVDDLIRREQRFRVPNAFRLMRLKRMKLVIKDRLFRLARQPARA